MNEGNSRSCGIAGAKRCLPSSGKLRQALDDNDDDEILCINTSQVVGILE